MAIYFSTYVESPQETFGGLMVVGPPGVLKSSMLEMYNSFDQAISIGNANMTTFRGLYPHIQARHYRLIAFEEFANIYAGDPRTGNRLESTIQAIVEQGCSTIGLMDERSQRLVAKACVVGAMVPEFRDKHYQKWTDSGFDRRFLWSLIRLSNPEKLIQAVIEWKRIELSETKFIVTPVVKKITPQLSNAERQELSRLVRYQAGTDHASQLRMICKITEALIWMNGRVNNKSDAMKTIHKFGQTLGKHGAELSI